MEVFKLKPVPRPLEPRISVAASITMLPELFPDAKVEVIRLLLRRIEPPELATIIAPPFPADEVVKICEMERDGVEAVMATGPEEVTPSVVTI